ncbi:MAG: rod shape-determining protein [Clostridiales bacterium]|nr:rod shape-determining protein [Clostridiales bacterium]
MSRDLGIDLGTANTLVYVRGKGIVLREPSVVAVRGSSGAILAVGQEAKEMIGRTPGNIVAVRPLRDGVIADFAMTETMLRYFIQKAAGRGHGLLNPRIVICVPCGITEVEKRAVQEAARSAGAKETYLLEEPMAAAIGAGLPIEEAKGCMIVDIGGGTTEVAVISLGGIVSSRSVRVGGNHMDDAIVSYIKQEYNMMIGERTAEEVKIRIGSVFRGEIDESMDIRGRDLVNGLPCTATITSEEIASALKESALAIVGAIRHTLERTPPELAGDIIHSGIVLSGGSAALRGLDKLIALHTGMKVCVAEDPLTCVTHGAGAALEQLTAPGRRMGRIRRK